MVTFVQLLSVYVARYDVYN